MCKHCKQLVVLSKQNTNLANICVIKTDILLRFYALRFLFLMSLTVKIYFRSGELIISFIYTTYLPIIQTNEEPHSPLYTRHPNNIRSNGNTCKFSTEAKISQIPKFNIIRIHLVSPVQTETDCHNAQCALSLLQRGSLVLILLFINCSAKFITERFVMHV